MFPKINPCSILGRYTQQAPKSQSLEWVFLNQDIFFLSYSVYRGKVTERWSLLPLGDGSDGDDDEYDDGDGH